MLVHLTLTFVVSPVSNKLPLFVKMYIVIMIVVIMHIVVIIVFYDNKYFMISGWSQFHRLHFPVHRSHSSYNSWNNM